MASLESSLASIPGLAGYTAQTQLNQQRGLGDIQQATGLLGLLQAVQAQAQTQKTREALAQSGGDAEKAVAMALQAGDFTAAHALAPLVKIQQEAKQRQILQGGNLNDPAFLRQAGLALGKPEFLTHAERIDKLAEEQKSLGALQDKPTQVTLPQGQQADTEAQAIQQAQALHAQGQPVRIGVGYTPEAQTTTVLSGGALSTLMQSPIPAIASHAKVLQQRINAGGIPLAMANQAIERLHTQEATFLQQQGQQSTQQAFSREMQADRIANRQEQPLVSIVGPDGQPQLVTREEAVGKTPWVGSPDQVALKITGGRESVYVQRMMMGANQAAKDLANVVQLPLTATTGPLGGRRQGYGLLEAGKEVLANTVTPQEAQSYNAMATGFQRSLAQIESAGLMPSGALTHQMDAVLFKAGDTNLTKLHKLAQTRQIVEAGMEVIEANPRVSPEEKAKVKTVLESIRKSVPFTHSDLIKMQVEQETNPKATLKDVLGEIQKVQTNPAVDALLDKYK